MSNQTYDIHGDLLTDRWAMARRAVWDTAARALTQIAGRTPAALQLPIIGELRRELSVLYRGPAPAPRAHSLAGVLVAVVNAGEAGDILQRAITALEQPRPEGTDADGEVRS